jgi:alpha-1,6-mannosyltransferase
MHIADLTMFYAAESGGVRRYLEAKRSWLAAHEGYRHSLVLPQGVAPAGGEGTVEVPSLPLPFAGGYRLPYARQAVVRTLAGLRPDIIEAGDPYRLAWAALDAGQLLGVPVLGFYHSDLPRMLGRLWGARSERLATAYVRRLYRAFDLVLAPSEAMVERLREMGVDRVCRQPLGVDTGLFRPRRRREDRNERELWRQRLGAGPGDRLLLYVGRFAPEKNLAVLAQALDRLGPGHILVLVGQGAAPPPRARLRVLPYVGERQRLATLIASCDAFVHAGDQETFGLAALEAMACGLPVIAAHAGGLAELVDETVGASVPPGSPDALAAAAQRLFSRDLGRVRSAARRRARAYDWQRVLPPMIARYHALCAIGRAASDHAPGPPTASASRPVRLHS